MVISSKANKRNWINSQINKNLKIVGEVEEVGENEKRTILFQSSHFIHLKASLLSRYSTVITLLLQQINDFEIVIRNLKKKDYSNLSVLLIHFVVFLPDLTSSLTNMLTIRRN